LIRSAAAAALALATTLAAVLAAGCAPRRGAATAAALADPAAAPWEIPAGALGTQRLFRVSYDGPEGGGSFRLTLRLDAAERYQVRAVDPVGRALWTLDVAGTSGLWLDHRAEAACRLEGSLDLAAGRLTPFPLAALPALLLGRLPSSPQGELEETAAAGDEPGEAGENAEGGRRVAFTDAGGRRWSATLDGTTPRAWALTEPADEAPSVWWRRHAGEHLLSDRRRNVQLGWRETVVEPLAGGLAAVAVPPGFALVPCPALASAI
jgi:hypothetical protein